jgi:hypothetical protein
MMLYTPNGPWMSSVFERNKGETKWKVKLGMLLLK